MAGSGYVTAGLDSILYFDRFKSPERLARDLSQAISGLKQAYGADGVVLLGYSFGADVLPFAFNRLPADVRSSVRAVVLLNPSRTADFWLGIGLLVTWTGLFERPTLPELQAVRGTRVLCFYGVDTASKSLCPAAPASTEAIALPGGHHFDGDYAKLGSQVITFIASNQRPEQI